MDSENCDESSERSGPWGTLALLAVWALVLLAFEIGGDGETPWRWGLNPGFAPPTGLLSYSFLHAGWGHLIANALPLLLLGPLLEDRWGRAFYSGFLVLAAVTAGVAYELLVPGSEIPLVGANGVVSALMGACLVRFWSTPVRFIQALWALRLVRADAWSPIWVMLPIWLFTRLMLAAFSDSSEVVGGAAHWCDVSGFVFGVAVAGGLSWGDTEGRYFNRAVGRAPGSTGRSLLDRALEMRTSGQTDAAYALLSDSVRGQTDESEVVETFWELARELRKTEDAASLVLSLAGGSLARGDEAEAVRIWKDVAERASNASAPRRLILRMVPVLLAHDERALAVASLRRAFDPRLGELRTGPALQLLEMAQEIDPPVALLAARRVLESNELPLEKRGRIESLAAELEELSSSLPPFDPGSDPAPAEDSSADRGISLELDPADDIVLPSQSQAPPPTAAVRELDATGSLVASDSDGELVPSTVPPDRWAAVSDAPTSPAPDVSTKGIATDAAQSVARFFSVKVVEVAPDRLASEGVALRRISGGNGLVSYAKIQAIAVGAVSGLADTPVLVIDLVMNWNDVAAEQLQVLRLRSDGFDVRALMPQAVNSVEAFRAVLEQLLARTGAIPLPDRGSARGRPFSTHADLSDYQRVVLQVDG
ncbi:MAG: rhomboid family intramembrane serine protease [Deltaproteobacteria bacterium]|nr:rhomboid family intramembrane serine protease [Deltaproteobacteria bacterium]